MAFERLWCFEDILNVRIRYVECGSSHWKLSAALDLTSASAKEGITKRLVDRGSEIRF